MSVIELAFITAFVAIVVLLSCLIGAWLSVSPFLVGVPLGIALFLLLLLGNRYLRKHTYPKCMAGICGSEEYEYVSDDESEATWITLKCRCGQLYRLQGDSFFALTDDGQIKKYKIRKYCLATWTDDVD